MAIISEAIFSDHADRPVAVNTADVPWRDTGNRVGIKLRDMSFSDAKRGFNLRVAVGLTTTEAFSPRHRHTFEQIRYYIDGAAKFGDVIYQPGDCVYFPEGVAYGPQIGYGDRDSLHMTLQFSGPSGIYYPSPEEQDRAHRELAETGKFIGGKYRDGAGTEQDAFEATLAHMTGKAVKYPVPRYDHPIRMRASAFTAVPDARDARIAVRHLASFNEIGPEIGFVNASAGACLDGGRPDHPQVRFLLSGRADFEGRSYEGLSCFFFPSQIEHDALVAETNCEFLDVRFGVSA